MAYRRGEGYIGVGFAGERGCLLQTLVMLKEGGNGYRRKGIIVNTACPIPNSRSLWQASIIHVGKQACKCQYTPNHRGDIKEVKNIQINIFC